jgi:hypothetical protein
VTWVGFSVPPIRCIVVKVSGLFETFTVGFMPLIWMTIIDEMSPFIIVVLWLGFSQTFRRVIKTMLTAFMVITSLLIISWASILQIFWSLLPFIRVVLMSFARSGSTHVVVEVFLLPFKLCHVLDRTNWHQIKLLEVVVFNDITIGNRISLELMSRISSCLGSDFIELLDLLFEREVCSLKVLNKLVLRLHDKDLLVKFLL